MSGWQRLRAVPIWVWALVIVVVVGCVWLETRIGGPLGYLAYAPVVVLALWLNRMVDRRLGQDSRPGAEPDPTDERS